MLKFVIQLKKFKFKFYDESSIFETTKIYPQPATIRHFHVNLELNTWIYVAEIIGIWSNLEPLGELTRTNHGRRTYAIHLLKALQDRQVVTWQNYPMF